MRFELLLFLVTAAAAQSGPRIQFSHTTESLRGVSAVSRQIAWASGTHGTYLRTMDAGRTWTPAQVPDATTLDFRAVVAFSATEAFLMSSGPGDQSRIYHTSDGGQHWQLQFRNPNPKGFFDAMQFWDPKHGIVLGDPIPDENGKLHFELLQTEDGQTWHQVPPTQLPEALEGEGAFAASNSCIAILHSRLTVSQSSSSSDPVILSEAVTSEAQPGRRRIPTMLLQPAAKPEVLATGPVGQSPLLAASRKGGASAPPQPVMNEAASAPDLNIWFASGGKTARVFHSPD